MSTSLIYPETPCRVLLPETDSFGQSKMKTNEKRVIFVKRNEKN